MTRCFFVARRRPHGSFLGGAAKQPGAVRIDRFDAYTLEQPSDDRGNYSWIRNRSRFLTSLIHAGARPRPDQVAPDLGSRYFASAIDFA